MGEENVKRDVISEGYVTLYRSPIEKDREISRDKNMGYFPLNMNIIVFFYCAVISGVANVLLVVNGVNDQTESVFELYKLIKISRPHIR